MPISKAALQREEMRDGGAEVYAEVEVGFGKVGGGGVHVQEAVKREFTSYDIFRGREAESDSWKERDKLFGDFFKVWEGYVREYEEVGKGGKLIIER